MLIALADVTCFIPVQPHGRALPLASCISVNDVMSLCNANDESTRRRGDHRKRGLLTRSTSPCFSSGTQIRFFWRVGLIKILVPSRFSAHRGSGVPEGARYK